MATKKQKVRVIPFDNRATEVRPGVWAWRVGAVCWYWSTAPGINLVMAAGAPEGDQPRGPEDQVVTPVASMATLKEAALFSEGFDAGARHARQPASAAAGPAGG